MNHGFVEMHGESVFCRTVFEEGAGGEKAQAGVPWEAKVLGLESPTGTCAWQPFNQHLHF